jgi:pilus assembly protein Flp/PilA
MKASLKRFWHANSGETAVEYAMIAAGVALAVVAGVTQLGMSVSGLYNDVVAALK